MDNFWVICSKRSTRKWAELTLEFRVKPNFRFSNDPRWLSEFQWLIRERDPTIPPLSHALSRKFDNFSKFSKIKTISVFFAKISFIDHNTPKFRILIKKRFDAVFEQGPHCCTKFDHLNINEFHIILKRRNFEICKHLSFLIIDVVLKLSVVGATLPFRSMSLTIVSKSPNSESLRIWRRWRRTTENSKIRSCENKRGIYATRKGTRIQVV